ncbi:MAG: DinB family protein [Ignavibacteriales bacterium]|nr:DinB family protein [Ignavibacteriales bacterium]
MNRRSLSFRTLFAILAVVAALTLQMNTVAAKDEPKSGFIAEVLGQLDQVKGQVISLEGAIPQDKFSWRPMEGVRSVSEVYLHIADGLYIFANAAGLKSPYDNKTLFDEKTRDVRTTDKAEIAKELNTSFDWTKSAIAKLTNADLEKKVEFFGMKMTVRNVLITLLNHTHEHLGQSIAYARSNGVVPPWTAKQQEEMNRNASKK